MRACISCQRSWQQRSLTCSAAACASNSDRLSLSMSPRQSRRMQSRSESESHHGFDLNPCALLTFPSPSWTSPAPAHGLATLFLPTCLPACHLISSVLPFSIQRSRNSLIRLLPCQILFPACWAFKPSGAGVTCVSSRGRVESEQWNKNHECTFIKNRTCVRRMDHTPPPSQWGREQKGKRIQKWIQLSNELIRAPFPFSRAKNAS